MVRVAVAALIFFLATSVAVAAPAHKKVGKGKQVKRMGRAWGTPGPADPRHLVPIRPAPKQIVGNDQDTLAPTEGDPDRERIQRLQEALDNIVHGPVLGRLRV